MNRTQRRMHLVVWAVLGPALLITVLAVTLGSESNQPPAPEAAP